MTDFQKFLADEFADRASRNPAYSLRAFAKNLNVDSSYLSKILNGKRQLSPRTIVGLCKKLGMNPEDIQKFVNFPNTTHQIKDIFTPLEIDNFKLISEWYHFAILELTRVHDFTPDNQWIAKTLKISFAETLAAVERLKRLDMIVEEDGKWKLNAHNSTTHHPFTNEALKKVQRQILEKSIQALDEIPFEERDQTTITMAVSTDRMKKAREKIKKFRRELMEFLEGGEEKDRVYQLNVSLFPLSYHSNQENKA